MQLKRYKLTDDLRVVLTHARREAERRHALYLDVEHLMLGLLRHYQGIAHTLFRSHDCDMEALYEQVANAIGMERNTTIEIKGSTKDVEAALDRAQDEANALNQSVLNEGHLLLSLMQESSGVLHELAQTLPFDADKVRDSLRDYNPPASSDDTTPVYLPTQHASEPVKQRGRFGRGNKSPQQPDTGDEYVLIPTRTKRRKAADDADDAPSRGLSNRALIGLGALALVAYLVAVLPRQTVFTFVFVLVGWIFSVTLHEFAHAAVAYIGGDHTVKEKGYLSFNPMKYTHPMLSIGLPLVFLALGGIGLPGGAVYIERHRLKNKWWGAAVSAAGPIANLILAILLSLPFLLGAIDMQEVAMNIVFDQRKSELMRNFPGLTEDEVRTELGVEHTLWNDPTLWGAVAFLAMLQFTAVFFNLIPIPPLDGFGIIEPYLDRQTRMRFQQIGMMGLFLIFFLFLYIEPVQNAFWDGVFDTTSALEIPRGLIDEGHRDFMFWRFDQ